MSRNPGPIGCELNPRPSRSPGSLGINDAADPANHDAVGDTPGTLGIQDHASLLAGTGHGAVCLATSGNLQGQLALCPSPTDESEITVPAWSPDAEERLSQKELFDANEILITFNWNKASGDKVPQRRFESLNLHYEAVDYVNTYEWAYSDSIIMDGSGIRDATVVLRHRAQIGDPLLSSMPATPNPSIAIRRAADRLKMIADLSRICPHLELQLSGNEQHAIDVALSNFLSKGRTWHAPTGGTTMPVVDLYHSSKIELGVPADCRNAIRKRFATGAVSIKLRSLRVHFRLGQPRHLGDPADASVLVDITKLEALRQALRDAVLLAAIPLRLRIYGYADRLGGEADNQALSERRAAWLRKQIEGDAAVSAITEIGAKGCGEHLAPASPQRKPEYRVAIARLEPSEPA